MELTRFIKKCSNRVVQNNHKFVLGEVIFGGNFFRKFRKDVFRSVVLTELLRVWVGGLKMVSLALEAARRVQIY